MVVALVSIITLPVKTMLHCPLSKGEEWEL